LHPDKINETPLFNILSGTRCKWCVWESRRGEGSYNWKGGITGIKVLLRERINEWKKEALENFDYKCDITGGNFNKIEIHHTKPFHVIRDEAIKELGLDTNEYVSDYSNEQIKELVNLFNEKHQEVLGIPLHKDLHKLFHKLYGFDTTIEDYKEFKQRYYEGEFKVKSIENWKKKTADLAQMKKKKPGVIYKGNKISFAEASRITGISINTLHERYKRGDREEQLFRKVKGLGCSKLTNYQVSEIKEMLKQGIKQTTIAKKFGVGDATITNIKKESSRKYKS
jgi:transposase